MEFISLCLLVFAIGLVGLFILAGRVQARADRWNKAFAKIAKRFGGQLSAGGWFRSPQVRLRHGQIQARLSAFFPQGKQHRGCLDLAAQLPQCEARLQIVAHTASQPLIAEMFGLPRIELDGGDIESRWQVLSDSEDEARRLLTGGVRWQLEQLWQIHAGAEVAVSISQGWMLIRKRWTAPDGGDMEAFVEQGLGLVDQLLLTRSVGIEWVGEGEIQLIEDARCAVCGELLRQEIVYCRRCKTPHHRDCWEYNQGCSTYGCRETLFLMPRPVTPRIG